jgi:hypothetical protein
MTRTGAFGFSENYQAKINKCIYDGLPNFPKKYTDPLLPLVGKGPCIIFVLDGSGSMQSALNNIQENIKNLLLPLDANGINQIGVVIYSDTEEGNILHGTVDSAKRDPLWLQNIKETAEWGGSVATDLTGILDPVEFMKQAHQHRRLDDMVCQLWTSMIQSTPDEPVKTESTNGDDECYVLKTFSGGLEESAKWIGEFPAGKNRQHGGLGYGGDHEEALMSAILAVMAAFGPDHISDVHMIVCTDAPPHLKASGEALSERESFKYLGLPCDEDYVGTIFDMTYVAGVTISLILSGRENWTPGIANQPNIIVQHRHKTLEYSYRLMVAMVNSLAIFMSGKSQLPVQPNGDQTKMLADKLKIDEREVAGTIHQYTQSWNEVSITVHDSFQPTFPMPRINMSDKETNERIVGAFMKLFQDDPMIGLFMGPIAWIFFKAKGSLGDSFYDDWSQFTTRMGQTKYGGNPIVAALFNVMFVESRLNNTAELEEELEKFSETDQPNVSGKVLVYDGKPLSQNTFQNIGTFITMDMIDPLMDAVTNFKLLTVEEASALGYDLTKDLPLIERKYLPASVLNTGKYLNLVWALVMDNTTMPPRACAFKVACIMLAKMTGHNIIVALRLAAYRFVQKNVMRYLAFLIDDAFVPREDKNPLVNYKWWLQPVALDILIKVLQSLNATIAPHLVDRIIFLQRMVQLYRRWNDDLTINVSKSTQVAQKAGRLAKCEADYWVPETLIGPKGCVICKSVHDKYTDEGQTNPETRIGLKYHEDGTKHLPPNFKEDVLIEKNMDTVCSQCVCHYSVQNGPNNLEDGVRRGRGSNKPLCFMCRKYRHRNDLEVHIRHCTICKDKWIFASSSDNWTCAKCEHGAELDTITTYHGTITMTVMELTLFNPSVLKGIASIYGLEQCIVIMLFRARQNKENFFENMMLLGLIRPELSGKKLPMTTPVEVDASQFSIKLPNGIKIKPFPEWPFGQHTIAELIEDMTINSQTARQQLSTIKATRLHQPCDLGLCETELHPLSHLVSPCGQCAFVTCRTCLIGMTRVRPGTVTPIPRLICICGRGLSPETLGRINRRVHNASILAAQCAVDGNMSHRIAVCKGGPHPVLEDKEPTGKYSIKCRSGRVRVLEPYVGTCGVDNPDDDTTEYQCPECTSAQETYNVYLATQEAQDKARLDNIMIHTKEDVEEVMKAHASGTVFRKCPGCENNGVTNYVTLEYVGCCSHIHCGTCQMHWCWICRANFNTSNECYQHMNEFDDSDHEDDDDNHRDCYNVHWDTPLDNTDDVICVE